MYIILGIIVGAFLTYLLTSSKEIKAYRRDRLEKCAFSLAEFNKIITKYNRKIIEIITNDDIIPQQAKHDIDNIRIQINEDVEDVDTGITLHAYSLEGFVRQYGIEISNYIIRTNDIITKLSGDPSKDSEYLEHIEKLYDEIQNAKADLILAISREIYPESYYSVFFAYVKRKIKWPSN